MSLVKRQCVVQYTQGLFESRFLSSTYKNSLYSITWSDFQFAVQILLSYHKLRNFYDLIAKTSNISAKFEILKCKIYCFLFGI